ncbi:MAG: 23S rRNA (adenine(2030)-N(6))-methyltransferase RlmJ [Sulfuricaulis sp.]|uniref:23S rRNA (adenine(2030)-N(6))-methyltransferase RlmJ n=1 Tax=Sulfuricaulis sp. TaxID=2003553 RepID=UPI0025E64626|nr:23S rRNA (adenine(2030)-N(6))-methyltransferase RlmJ [Sulfuricaulis sp.]MCR4346734.1 23S rRNA (adenine(2030)-N(6))-methyltransferase RlmJ [Sulfuricaulis sp.]
MNYRHIFHAGNFADVFKHVVLSLLLKSLHKKETPFCYLDTHAGASRYDLSSAAAQKTGEYRDGIKRLWNNSSIPEVADYLAAVRALNDADSLRYYPGSPRVARFFLRPQDRAVLFELQPEECTHLKNEFAGDRQVLVQGQDGYAGLKALLPPKERRGLVLIDPPYESDKEFEQVIDGLRIAHARWDTGMYALWYPIKGRPPVERFHRMLVATGIRKILLAEFSPYPEDSGFRLNGCGMVVINPAWKLDETLQSVSSILLERLRQHPAARAAVTWLVPE